MLLGFVVVLWFCVMLIGVSRHIKERNMVQQPIQQHVNNEGVSNSWIINYIRDKGGRVFFSEAEDDFAKFLKKKVRAIILDMINDGTLNVGMDTKTFEEYIELVEVQDGKPDWVE